MSRWIPLWALTVATYLFAMSWALADWPVADMNKTIDETNFVVNSGCSGTLVDAQQLFVLTANHCVTDQYETVEREEVGDDGVVTTKKVRVFKDGTVSQIEYDAADSIKTTTYKVRVVAVDKDKDLALLRIRVHLPWAVWDKTAPKIACVAPIRGETVYAVGNPMGILYSSVTKGIVSSVQRTYGGLEITEGSREEPMTQFSSGIIGGNSGGALYNDRGELVGVPVRGSRANEILGFATPLAAIKSFLKNNRLDYLYAHCTPKE